MRYIGSKVTVVPELFATIHDEVPTGTFCDPFGGVGVVGAYFKARGFKVWTGDMLRCAHCFQIARVGFNRRPQFRRLRQELGVSGTHDVETLLNGLRPSDGWFVREYSLKRRFFVRENAFRIQACRSRIATWYKKGWLSDNEHAVLLASLIDSFDKVANTAGTYYAFLKRWNRKALRDFSFTLIPPARGAHRGSCHYGDAVELVRKQFYDILYLDPPYNERDYAAYYHLPETIATGSSPRTHGASGIPVRRFHRRSTFNTPELASHALQQIAEAAKCRLLAFHYSDTGLIPPDRIRRILANVGPCREVLLSSKGYTTKHASRTTQHRLYMVKCD